jgi:copper transporter 1
MDMPGMDTTGESSGSNATCVALYFFCKCYVNASLFRGMMSASFVSGLGPTLWFAGWTPSSPGATFAACLGLFLLAAVSRLLNAVAGALHVSRLRYSPSSSSSARIRLEKQDDINDEDQTPAPLRRSARARLVPPFVLSVDLGRGVLSFFTWGIGYFLMLAVVRICFFLSLSCDF